MRVLIAWEESQAVCKAFRARGHEAYSCDIQEPSGGHPEWHVLGDALEALKGGTITTMDGMGHDVGKWDLLIAHPPCTYMSNSSAVRMRVKGEIVQARYAKMLEAKAFFMAFYNADVPRVAIENPVPMKLVGLPKYDQIVQPYQFGHPYSKKTCLWLRGVPPLTPTEVLGYHVPYVNGGNKDAHGNYRRFPGRKERDPKIRSKTFRGIAEAMAEQWGGRNVKTSEIIKALRCTATVHVDDIVDCENCPFFTKNPVPEEEIGQVPKDFYYFCDSDRICLEAAERMEELSGKDANVPDEMEPVKHGQWKRDDNYGDWAGGIRGMEP